MNDIMFSRVKNSLNVRHYRMNDSWLAECIEYYLQEHVNSSQEEIISFVITQWVLCDLREINNEMGSLPKNLCNQKCTTLPGNYILQMDKIYDISVSKYKQLEKIRHVSNENVEATEIDNASQEYKTQAWEPKTKRMLQLFLTDGIQDVLAIEYKPIRFLKDSLYPGFKLLIKGPVICRKGVILLEESNIEEVGGEVENLLIDNAVENVFARALNLEQNPDPYNDNNKNMENTQKSTSTQRTEALDDEFDIDSEAIDQIEKQIQQNNSNINKVVTTTDTRNKQKTVPTSSSTISRQGQNTLTTSNTQNLIRSAAINQESKSSNNFSSNKIKIQPQRCNQNSNIKVANFEDDDDSFLEMVDEKVLENFSLPKTTSTGQSKAMDNKQTPSNFVSNTNVDDFPMADEEYDLIDNNYTTPVYTSKPKSEPMQAKSSVFRKPVTTVPSKQQISSENANSERIGSVTSNDPKDKPTLRTNLNYKNLLKQFPSPLKPEPKLSKVSVTNIPDDDFEMDDFDMKTDDFKDYFKKDKKPETRNEASTSTSSNNFSKLKSTNTDDCSPCQASKSTSSKTSLNEISSGKYHSIGKLEPEFETDFEVEFESKMDVDYKPIKIEQKEIDKINQIRSMKSPSLSVASAPELTTIKRPSSVLSPCKDEPQKLRCLESTPKSNKSGNRKITDFLNKPKLLNTGIAAIYEFIRDVVRDLPSDKEKRAVVRGKVIKIVKLNLLKGEDGPYFHLEGTITDNTENLDVVFSTETLEKVIGYSPQEFSQKRRQSKNNPDIKNQLVEDLKKAQQTLRVMDELMEIKFVKNEKPLILHISKLSKEHKAEMDLKVKSLKK